MFDRRYMFFVIAIALCELKIFLIKTDQEINNNKWKFLGKKKR